MTSTSLRIEDNTLGRIKAFKEGSECLDKTLNRLLDRLLSFDEEHIELKESIKEVAPGKAVFVNKITGKPIKPMVVHVEQEEKPIDKLTQYFLDHPEQDIDNYTDEGLKQLERHL